MKHFILSMLFSATLLTSCTSSDKRVVHPTTDKPGYCYFQDGLWYVYYLDPNTGLYSYSGAQSGFTSFSPNEVTSWTPSPENVSNFSEFNSEISESISESSGEYSGGSDSSGDSSSDSGISESSGDFGGDSSFDGGGGE